MLSHIRIKNFALINELNIDFGSGLNVITGETGAGKSIIIEAINTILGGPASSQLIKSDADFLEVEALFTLNLWMKKRLESLEAIRDILTEHDHLIIRRQIHQKKKNKCWVNNYLVTLSLLQRIGNYLIDLHGQHSHQSLLNSESHIDFIDNLGDHSHLQKRERLSHYFYQWQAKTKLINQLSQKRAENLSQRDYLLFQSHEIDSARLKDGEDQELEAKLNIIRHTVKIKEIMEMATMTLHEGGQEGESSLLDALTKMIRHFNEIAELDQGINRLKEQLTELQFKLEDVVDQIIEYKDSMDFDAGQLQEFEDRLSSINHLKQKYGQTLKDVMNYRISLKNRLNQLEDDQERIEKLKAEREEDEEKLTQLSLDLSEQRRKISGKVEKEIIVELKELNMKSCRFMIQIYQHKDEAGIVAKNKRYKITPKGIDHIEFFISTNAGERLKPLADIVSGGEVSRIMLGLKSILSKADQIPTMIFDEIDSGVGARLGEVIANKLSKISQNHQVIAVTHLPQIACQANQHLYIYKYIQENHTGIQMKKLKGDEQLNEIARMLDGERYGSISIEHARKMLTRRDITEHAE